MERLKTFFYASDKDVFDLIMANPKKLPDNLLIELLRDHGFVLSNEELRESIASYLSTLGHNVFILQQLIDQTETSQRSDKYASVVVETSLNDQELMDCINELKKNRENMYSEVYTPRLESNNVAKIPVHYEEMDYGKTNLMQRREKRAEIQVEVEGGKVVIRGPANDKGGDIVRDFVKAIETSKNTTITQHKIELSGVVDPASRSKFFLSLIDNLEGYTTLDVTSIKVDKEIVSLNDIDDEGDEDVKEEVISQVKRALLDGAGLVHSPEFKRFTESGFYISKIEWLSIGKSGAGPKIIFEASLDNPAEGTGFKYAAKGYYKQKEHKIFTTTKYKFTDVEKRDFLILLEKSAWKSLKALHI